MAPTIKLFGMLFGLVVLAGCPDRSVPFPPTWHFTMATYEEPRPPAQTFAALIAFFREHHPDLVADLNPPATDKQLDALETLTGQRLPDDFRRLYKLANGQNEGATSFFLDGYKFLSLEEISQDWIMMKKLNAQRFGFWESDTPQGVVKDRWWLPSWIPFAQDITGSSYCIDLDPAPGGQVGQVIAFIHDDTWRAHLGRSLNDYLGDYEKGLRAGTYVYHAEWGVFTSRDEG